MEEENVTLLVTSWTSSAPDATPSATAPTIRHLSVTGQVVVTVSYLLGVLGNIAALLILCRPRCRRPRCRRRHTLMLQCLAWNDLVALLGMLVQMYVQLYLSPGVASGAAHTTCVVRVFWRVFGLGSGCVAAAMAVERWLALTHPFLYQKHVTYRGLRTSIFVLWSVVLVLVCLPFLGFGVYFRANTCVRYRTATRTKDVVYAYLFFGVGTLLCACIVWCNLAVVRALCRLGCRGGGRAWAPALGRRISRQWSSSTAGAASTVLTAVGSSGGGGSSSGGGRTASFANSTAEEVAFARLMAVLSISFVVCWAPQMISILLAQLAPASAGVRVFFKAADVLMALHFTFDPYVYVLLRHRRRPCVPDMLKLVCRRCSRNSASQSASVAMTDLDQGASGQQAEDTA